METQLDEVEDPEKKLEWQGMLRAFYDLPAKTVSLHQGGPLPFGPNQILDQLKLLTAGSA